MTEGYSISQTNGVTARAEKPYDIVEGEGSPDESGRAWVLKNTGRKTEQTGNVLHGKIMTPVTGDEHNMTEAEFEATGPTVGPREKPSQFLPEHRSGGNVGVNNSAADTTIGEA